jgi:hypothetical protein
LWEKRELRRELAQKNGDDVVDVIIAAGNPRARDLMPGRDSNAELLMKLSDNGVFEGLTAFDRATRKRPLSSSGWLFSADERDASGVLGDDDR